jgi:hypothetical protein
MGAFFGSAGPGLYQAGVHYREPGYRNARRDSETLNE